MQNALQISCTKLKVNCSSLFPTQAFLQTRKISEPQTEESNPQPSQRR